MINYIWCCKFTDLFMLSEYDYVGIDKTIQIITGGFFLPELLQIGPYQDGVAEELEGFVLFLDVLESELDERDVGQVSLTRAAYLVRINQSGIDNSEKNYIVIKFISFMSHIIMLIFCCNIVITCM